MAVILIGLGVLGIGLAYTDRTGSVLAALTGKSGGGGGTPGAAPDPSKPAGPTNCPPPMVWNATTSECLNPAFGPGGTQPTSATPAPGAGGQYYVNAAGGVGSSSGATVSY